MSGRDTPNDEWPIGPVARATIGDEELISASLALASELTDRADARTTRRQGRQRARLARLVSSEAGVRLVFSLADRVLRPPSNRIAARQLAVLTRGDLPGLSRFDRVLLRVAGSVGRLAPRPVISLVAARLRKETAALVYPAAPPTMLGRRLQRQRSAGRRPNVNLLGEAVLGWEEARRRGAALEDLLARPELDCVSVKVSSISTGLSLLDLAGSLERVSEPLLDLYRAAMAFEPAKLINLDMEEHRDLDLTLWAFMSLLDRPELANLTAGIALQAYVPESHEALDRLLAWAEKRHTDGGAPIRIRLVKGANLAMETVEAELRGWPPAPYGSKAETDASYVGLMERLIAAAARGVVEVGIATHNLFDVALAIVMAGRAGAEIDIEMLAGMADAQAAAVAERTGRMLFYVPVTSKADFRRNALAYLARRLDENATPEGFLRHALGMAPGSPDWDDQAARFEASVRQRHQVSTRPRQHQDRRNQLGGAGGATEKAWRNEPDTDLTVASNRDWAQAALRSPRHPAPRPASAGEVGDTLARAVAAAPWWASVSSGQRRELLLRAAESLASGRADAISVMATEAGKTFAEADPEVSEAVDYARWYARGIDVLDQLESVVESRPLGVVLASPWNFPYAIPAGGALAALAAGNSVIIKPSPEATATTDLLVSQLQEAGLDRDQLQAVPAPDGAEGERLITDRAVGGIVLTGSLATAGFFRRLAPATRLLAETSGKNAIVVGGSADVDQAVSDLVRSAFGHAGQKCSAASLAIVDASIYDGNTFLRQLRDATASLRVGPATDPASEVGPIVGPFTEALERALTSLEPGESWLVAPRLLDPAARLWSPGVRIGVRPGSWTHLTEWFGPVLGVLRAEGLDAAIAIQNGVPLGLTAGLQSLDPEEHARWAGSVEAGNLYINRTTTGAIVGRQPFGGWKGSSLGPTAKAGGPNYLLGLRRWRDAETSAVEATRQDYERWWREYFSLPTELAGLRSEANLLRYCPFTPGVVVRMTEVTPEDEILKAAAASQITGTPLRVSSSTPRPSLAAAIERVGTTMAVESAASFAARCDGLRATRVRLLGAPEPEVVSAAGRHGLSVLDEPVCSHGRLELVRWLREQAVSRSLHRYGNVVYEGAAPSP